MMSPWLAHWIVEDLRFDCAYVPVVYSHSAQTLRCSWSADCHPQGVSKRQHSGENQRLTECSEGEPRFSPEQLQSAALPRDGMTSHAVEPTRRAARVQGVLKTTQPYKVKYTYQRPQIEAISLHILRISFDGEVI